MAKKPIGNPLEQAILSGTIGKKSEPVEEQSAEAVPTPVRKVGRKPTKKDRVQHTIYLGSSPSFRPGLSPCTIGSYPSFPVVFIAQSNGPALNQLDFPIGGFSPPEGRLARGFKPPAFSRFLFQSAVKSAESF